MTGLLVSKNLADREIVLERELRGSVDDRLAQLDGCCAAGGMVGS